MDNFLLFHLVPSQPLNVTVTTNGILRSLVVQWSIPIYPSGMITTYMVTYNDITISTNGNDTMYTIMGLDPFTDYTISVTTCTDNGCGNQTDVVIGTTEEEGISMYIYVL